MVAIFVSWPLVSLAGGESAGTGGGARKLRCGWFDNPSPGNASLFDREGEWIIAMQGEHTAKGKWPEFKKSEWVSTGNGSYGYGCLCMHVTEDAEKQYILDIHDAKTKPLAACRSDKKLTEPENPLKG
jgi:hypothetical protein